MKLAQVYCTLNNVISDMHQVGDSGIILERIKAASTAIQREIGIFIPICETRNFSGRGQKSIVVTPVLSVDKVLDDGIEVTDFTLLPETAPWIHGPANMIKSSGHWSRDTVEITGKFGKYDELRSVLDQISLDIDDLELSIPNASLLDVGMVMLVEDEQFCITGGHGSKNSPAPTLATSLLDGDITEDDQVITVDNGSDFHKGEVLAIGNEDLFILRITGNELVVVRGWNDSLIEAHDDDSTVSVYRTFAIDRGVNGTTAAAHTDEALFQYLVPDDINWLCRQIAGLMLKKAESGFQGRVGSAETGDAMYFSEFPPNQIARIKEHYSIKAY